MSRFGRKEKESLNNTLAHTRPPRLWATKIIGRASCEISQYWITSGKPPENYHLSPHRGYKLKQKPSVIIHCMIRTLRGPKTCDLGVIAPREDTGFGDSRWEKIFGPEDVVLGPRLSRITADTMDKDDTAKN